MSNQSFTLQDWWENATASGKARYGTIENLAAETKLTLMATKWVLKQEAVTLQQWWKKLGKSLFGGSIQKFSDELTMQMPAGRRYPRTTLSDHVRGKSEPKYEDQWRALYAITALPKYNVGFTETEPVIQQVEKTAVDFPELGQAELLAQLLAEKLTKLINLPLSQEQEERLQKVLEELQDKIQNIELSRQLGRVFEQVLDR